MPHAFPNEKRSIGDIDATGAAQDELMGDARRFTGIRDKNALLVRQPISIFMRCKKRARRATPDEDGSAAFGDIHVNF